MNKKHLPLPYELATSYTLMPDRVFLTTLTVPKRDARLECLCVSKWDSGRNSWEKKYYFVIRSLEVKSLFFFKFALEYLWYLGHIIKNYHP